MRPATLVVALLVLGACSPTPGYSGTVQTESVAVGSQVGGRVIEVDVQAGTRVHRGSIVLRLDPGLLQAQYDQARAQERQASERLAELVNGNIPSDIEHARAQSAAAQAQYRQAVDVAGPQAAAQAAEVRDAEAGLTLAQATYTRTRSLAATGDVSQESLDQARAGYDQAVARVAQARKAYDALVEAQLPGQQANTRENARAQSATYTTVLDGPRPEEIAQARAAESAAKAAVDHAAVQLREAVVTAPADGAVESFDLHPGDLIAAGQPAAIIDTFADPYVYIYASQRDLASLPDGRRVKVTSDSGNGVFDGVVETHDRTAQFTPQNVETADQRAELVYGVKIRIHDPERKLLDGTTVTVYVQ